MKRSKKVELNPNIKFGGLVFFSQFSPAGKVLESPAQFHAQIVGTKIITLLLPILYWLEKYTYEGGTKIALSRFLSRPGFVDTFYDLVSTKIFLN